MRLLEMTRRPASRRWLFQYSHIENCTGSHGNFWVAGKLRFKYCGNLKISKLREDLGYTRLSNGIVRTLSAPEILKSLRHPSLFFCTVHPKLGLWTFFENHWETVATTNTALSHAMTVPKLIELAALLKGSMLGVTEALTLRVWSTRLRPMNRRALIW